MPLRKKLLLFIGIAAVCAAAAGSFCLYKSFHPTIMITRMIKDSDARSEGAYYCEWLMMISGESSLVPTAAGVKAHMMEFSIWNNDVVTDLYENYGAPLHITASGQVKDGKTTFWYEGYATTPEGETVEYREEATFDYVFVPGDELLQ